MIVVGSCLSTSYKGCELFLLIYLSGSRRPTSRLAERLTLLLLWLEQKRNCIEWADRCTMKLVMRHVPNENLKEGTYRIICSGCNKVYHEGEGDLTQAAIVGMRYPDRCEDCNGEVVLETNPIPHHNTYDVNNPYPN